MHNPKEFKSHIVLKTQRVSSLPSGDPLYDFVTPVKCTPLPNNNPRCLFDMVINCPSFVVA